MQALGSDWLNSCVTVARQSTALGRWPKLAKFVSWLLVNLCEAQGAAEEDEATWHDSAVFFSVKDADFLLPNDFESSSRAIYPPSRPSRSDLDLRPRLWSSHRRPVDRPSRP